MTPANFLFGPGMDVAAIDLERMKRGDRMFDSDQGTKDYQGCAPDYTITDLPDLLTILGLR